MHFLDQAKIYIRSGAGGPGAVSFRREKYVEYGGPDGGNGGRGGDVVFEAVAGLNTLIDFRYTQHFKAQRGIHGSGKDRNGAAGKDMVIKVPVGTQILDDDRETVLADLTEAGQRITLLHGGLGGRGNASYKTSTNRAPRQHQPGEPFEEMWVWLRLKLLADAGLVGLPNAGKSTFINQITNAKAKVGDYAFTTLRPQLGVVRHKGREFVLADIPGLIAGAAEGAGVGDRFLGHIERCRVLIHLIDAERIFAFRVLWGLRGDRATLPGFNQVFWMEEAHVEQRSIKDLLKEWKIVRENTLFLLKQCSEAQSQFQITAANWKVSVRALFYIIIGHQLHHMQMLREKYI